LKSKSWICQKIDSLIDSKLITNLERNCYFSFKALRYRKCLHIVASGIGISTKSLKKSVTKMRCSNI